MIRRYYYYKYKYIQAYNKLLEWIARENEAILYELRTGQIYRRPAEKPKKPKPKPKATWKRKFPRFVSILKKLSIRGAKRKQIYVALNIFFDYTVSTFVLPIIPIILAILALKYGEIIMNAYFFKWYRNAGAPHRIILAKYYSLLRDGVILFFLVHTTVFGVRYLYVRLIDKQRLLKLHHSEHPNSLILHLEDFVWKWFVFPFTILFFSFFGASCFILVGYIIIGKVVTWIAEEEFWGVYFPDREAILYEWFWAVDTLFLALFLFTVVAVIWMYLLDWFIYIISIDEQEIEGLKFKHEEGHLYRFAGILHWICYPGVFSFVIAWDNSTNIYLCWFAKITYVPLAFAFFIAILGLVSFVLEWVIDKTRHQRIIEAGGADEPLQIFAHRDWLFYILFIVIVICLIVAVYCYGFAYPFYNLIDPIHIYANDESFEPTWEWYKAYAKKEIKEFLIDLITPEE